MSPIRQSSRAGLARVARCGALIALMTAAPAQAREEQDRSRPPTGSVVPSEPEAKTSWRQTTAMDVAFIARTIRDKYIYARYPVGPQFAARFDPAVRDAEKSASTITDYAGYRAVLERLVNSVQDPHVTIKLAEPDTVAWPGFTARYVMGHALVRTSRTSAIKPGSEITSCDGRPIVRLADQVALLEGGIPRTQSSRAIFTPRVFVDDRNPFRTRPSICRIGGADVALNWQPSTGAFLSKRVSPPIDDVPPGLSDFGTDGAWIRLPTMSPQETEVKKAYRSLIAAAPGLRPKRVIIFDVRDNPGGGYDWFIDILNALYGQDLTNYLARERLKIRPVFISGAISPADLKPAPAISSNDRESAPVDAQLEAVTSRMREITLRNGRGVITIEPANPAARRRPAGPRPANPVRAKVYVLTDGGCKSACLSFLDEILKFLGVEQIGAASGVDMRSGSPATYALPNGLGSMRVPTMLREYRTRGDNQEYLPAYSFNGEITDTAAVRTWISREILPHSTAAATHQ